ncbi:MAG: type II secretion system protein [Candidatus Gastranaerophilales bacterium]
MTKRFGFTLAEVLITLGIIGVVAAMTMPTLMNSTQGAQYKTALKKVISSISQGITLNYAITEYDFGTADAYTANATNTVALMLGDRMNVEEVDLKTSKYDAYSIAENSDTEGTTEFKAGESGTSYTCTATDIAGSAHDCEETTDTYTGKSTNFTLADFTSTPTSASSDYNALLFADGTMFIYSTKDSDCDAAGECIGYIDVNGTKGPNKIVGCDAPVSSTVPCTVSSPSDVYPVTYYNQRIVPYTKAGKAVLYN